MKDKTNLFLGMLFAAATLMGSAMIVLINDANKTLIAFLCLLFLLSTTLRQVFFSGRVRFRRYAEVLPFFDSAVAYWILFLDKTDIAVIFLLLVIVEVVIACSLFYSVVFTVISYISFVLINYLRMGMPPLELYVFNALVNSINFMFVFGVVYIMRMQIDQRRVISGIRDELQLKSEKLEESNLRLREASRELENLAVIRERNRIANEIHDTVGHTLTTVLVELEAGRRLLASDPDKGAEKIALAREQVRKGLGDLRTSVRMLKENTVSSGLAVSLEALARETEKHAGVSVALETIPALETLGETRRNILIRAFQEGLTNGIRHGGATGFSARFSESGPDILFVMEDNGKGCPDFKKGFGLKTMTERVENAGGSIRMAPVEDAGFRIEIRLPKEGSL